MPTSILDEYGKVEVKEITSLSFSKKVILGVCFLQRQISAVKQFDIVYKDNLSVYFLFCINKYKDFIKNPDDIRIDSKELKVVDEKIPDTEEYQDIEGTFAQNALIAVYYGEKI